MWIFLKSSLIDEAKANKVKEKTFINKNIPWGIFDTLWISYDSISDFLEKNWYEKNPKRHWIIPKCIYIFPETTSQKIYQNSNLEKNPVFALILNWYIWQNMNLEASHSKILVIDKENQYKYKTDCLTSVIIFSAMQKLDKTMSIELLENTNIDTKYQKYLIDLWKEKSSRRYRNDIWRFETNEWHIFFPKE